MRLLLARAGEVRFFLAPEQLLTALWFLGVLVATGVAGWGATAARSSGCAGSGRRYEVGIRALHRGLLALVVLGGVAGLGLAT